MPRFPDTSVRRCAVLFLLLLAAATLAAAPVEFDIEAQPASEALLAFSRQARVEVLFSFDELREVRTASLAGGYEPEAALRELLRGTGFAAYRYGRERFVIRSLTQPGGSIMGRLLTADGGAATGITVALAGTRLSATTDEKGGFSFSSVPPGRHRLFTIAEGFQPLRIENIEVEAGRISKLAAQKLQPAGNFQRLDPYVVQGRSARLRPLDDSAALLGPRRATGNLDLPRTENGVLPFAIYPREQITRSGVVALNEFLQRVILEGDAGARPPEQSASFRIEDGLVGSSNLRLRGYNEHETVILVNGRRLPEVQTSVTQTLPPDVNFIPLSLIQQIEVLPASASAAYSGNPVGGVINIVLRPDVTATEVTTTYTNTAGGYDAPQSSVSLQHGQTLPGGGLRLRVNAVYTATEPPTEAELGFRRAHDATRTLIDDRLYRATPNVRSADPGASGLFGPGTASFTSVAPGADGSGGLAAFAGREGVRNLDFFDPSGGLAASPTSIDSPYGRRQRRAAFFGSAAGDPFPWLHLGLDVAHSRTLLNRGHDVLNGNLTLGAASPLNPFGRDVEVSLAETAPLLGENYSEARISFSSAVAGVLFRLPSEWRASLDTQYARNIVKYRGLAGADPDRWQELVDAGLYQPLRDTQAHGPPAEFYDRVLVYRGGRGRFVTLGDYETLDAAVRISNQSLMLPTGRGAIIGGADYRRFHLAGYREEALHGDGTPAADPSERYGRTLERYSFFTELQAPLLSARLLPRWLRSAESDLALRYVASANTNEVNLAPTFGLKAGFPGGLAFRCSVTTSNRFPTPQISRPVAAPSVPGSGLNLEPIYDPLRAEFYDVRTDEAVDPGLPPEEAVTQTAGLIFECGNDHRFRASLDFIDTRKTGEILALTARDLVNVEAVFPDRVIREPPAPGDTHGAGRITRLITGSVNASWRHSQNWTAVAEYVWTGCLGGALELRSRFLYYQRYQQQIFANSPVVDQLDDPDGIESGLLRYRATFGANWSNRSFGFGLDGQYFHSRILPVLERPIQGGDRIKPYWQFDAYMQAELSRWFPWENPRRGLRAQLRVNNLSGFDYPKYANDGAGAGVQPYGDWRGRTYSLSLTTTF